MVFCRQLLENRSSIKNFYSDSPLPFSLYRQLHHSKAVVAVVVHLLSSALLQALTALEALAPLAVAEVVVGAAVVVVAVVVSCLPPNPLCL
jgi:hypothetical protein